MYKKWLKLVESSILQLSNQIKISRTENLILDEGSGVDQSSWLEENSVVAGARMFSKIDIICIVGNNLSLATAVVSKAKV